MKRNQFSGLDYGKLFSLFGHQSGWTRFTAMDMAEALLDEELARPHLRANIRILIEMLKERWDI